MDPVSGAADAVGAQEAAALGPSADEPSDAVSGDPSNTPDRSAAAVPSGAISSDPPTGWIVPPGGSDGQRRGRPLLLGCLVIGIALFGIALVAGPLIATGILDQSGSGGSDIQAIGFGSGGSGCALTDVASTFGLGDTVRDVVTFSPALSVGDTVTVKVEMNGRELVDRRQTIPVDQPASCLQGTLSPLEVGHYRVTVEVSSSSVPPIGGEFDVTP